jgi:hypothetical protein
MYRAVTNSDRGAGTAANPSPSLKLIAILACQWAMKRSKQRRFIADCIQPQ